MSNGMTAEAVKSIAKAELHVHLEGTITESLAKKIYARHGEAFPVSRFDANGSVIWNDFTDFIQAYDLLSESIKNLDDLQLVTYDYLKRSHEEGCIYSELTVSPLHAENAGMNYTEALEAITSGCRQAQQEFGIESRLVIVLVRHTGESACMATLDSVIANPQPYVVGIGLAGDERSHPARLFVEHFQKARANGLQVTAHAGEWGGAQQVQEAIDLLGVKRVGHGVQVIEDLPLMQRIIEHGIHLEVCPMSNIALGVFPDYESHPIHKFVENGLNFSLNSDDPPFFATTIGNEYWQAAKHLQLNEKQLKAITENAIRASFAEDSLKQQLLKHL